ncbi:hypothetical protein KFF47_21435 [Pseudomonas fluorescens]|nr:hypothetical protein [Pseudomonas fluorescens]
MSEVIQLAHWGSKRSGDKAGGGGHTGDGNPPGGDTLEARVSALEKASQEIREKLVRVETKLESIEANMATKAEIAGVGTIIAELKTSVAESMVVQTRWLIGACLALAALAFTAAKYVH